MKLRIPIFILTLVIASGVVERYPISTTIESIWLSISFFLIIGIIITIAEKTGLNDKKVNVFIGLFIVLLGVIFDLNILNV
ncbi:hypothetical protein [Paenibacillus wynnii]|uniref:Uncharacterized protein n=1 Tax=Paenibacillus wynnii TaxID=268407 RepID=A0A098M478_9BACL|nr:hypothetical protein [Paenibacillus wynnii]KGE16828.1 hypothetical protein PWYN_19250 [Paenibacillus wynnii]